MQLFCFSTKIQVALWMAGKTCGICGKYDAEIEREYQTPGGYLAKDAVSFGHSWIISEDPCAGGTKSPTYINIIAFNSLINHISTWFILVVAQSSWVLLFL